VSEDNIILFPLDRVKQGTNIKQDPKENAKKSAKIKNEKTREFVETHIDDLAMGLLRKFVDMAVKSDRTEFTKGLAILIDVMRGMLYRDFGVKHPAQTLTDKLVNVKETRNGPQAEINYGIVNDKKSKPLTKDMREDIKFTSEGWEDFNDDFDPN